MLNDLIQFFHLSTSLPADNYRAALVIIGLTLMVTVCLKTFTGRN